MLEPVKLASVYFTSGPGSLTMMGHPEVANGRGLASVNDFIDGATQRGQRSLGTGA